MFFPHQFLQKSTADRGSRTGLFVRKLRVFNSLCSSFEKIGKLKTYMVMTNPIFVPKNLCNKCDIICGCLQGLYILDICWKDQTLLVKT